MAALSALAQESRLAVFRLLVEHAPEGLAAGAIADRLGLAPATLSFHLKELVHARLIGVRPAGRFVWYRAELDAMHGLLAYLTENCCRAGPGAATQRAPGTSQPPVAVPVPRPKRRKTG